MGIRNPHVTARSAEMHGARWRGGAPPGELKDASEVARSAAERAAAGVWGRSPRKISRLFAPFIPPRGTFGNREQF